MNTGNAAHKLLMVAYEGVNLLDLSGPLQAFEDATRILAGDKRAGYELIVASIRGGSVKTGTGLAIMTVPLSSVQSADVHTIIVPGGTTDGTPPKQPEVVEWISANADKTKRLCAVCTGAFVLAETTLLNNRKATTHWRWATDLAARFPDVRVHGDSIYVKDEHVWTSAGVSAGVDLALALIAEDFGHRLAIDVARELVVYLKRSGGQSQFSTPLAHQRSDNGMFSDLLVWMNSHLHEELRVQRLAEVAGMSVRNFSRSFTEKIGTTPAKAVEQLRLEAAKLILQETDHSIKRIARDVGLGDEQNLRRMFHRRFGISPLEFRNRFSATSNEPNSAMQNAQ